MFERTVVRRRVWRLFLFAAVFIFTIGAVAQSGAGKTSVLDNIYRADGTPASGVVIISWPTFTSADGKPIAAGSLSLTIGSGGAFSANLYPTQGATPAGVYYKAVLKLADGTTSTEYWDVPATSTTTIAAIRSKVVPASVAVQMVSRTDLQTLAKDASVVHVSGTEQISGSKQFLQSPTVPAPATPESVVNRSYVDAAVSSISGTWLQSIDAQPMRLNGIRYADKFGSIQAAITDAGISGKVVVPGNYTGTDSFTNPNEIPVEDFRQLTVRDVDVRKHGAKLDVKMVAGCSMTSGSAVLTCTTANWKSSDIDKYAIAYGFGMSGAPITGKIISQLDATQVTLSVAASTTASSQKTVYGTNDAPAIQAAIDETGETASHKIYSGRVRIHGPALIASQLTVANKSGLILDCLGFGLLSTSDPGPGSFIIWAGNTSGSMVQFKNSTASGIENCHLIGNSGSKPVAGIHQYQVASEGHPNNRNWARNILIGSAGGYDPDDGVMQFQNGIYHSGVGTNNDQHRYDNIQINYAETCVNIPDVQSTDNLFNHLFPGRCTTAFSAVGRTEIHNVFFSNNVVDIVPLAAARINIYGMGSEGSGRMISTAVGADVTVKGGAWQAGPNLNADGKFIDAGAVSGVNLKFEDWRLSISGPPVTPVIFHTGGTRFSLMFPNTTILPQNLAVTTGAGANQFLFLDGIYRPEENQTFMVPYRNILNKAQTADFFRYDLINKVNVIGTLTAKQLDVPTIVSVTATGGTGTTYSYKVEALTNGKGTGVSSATTVSGGAALSSSVYNTVKFAPVIGADQYKIYGRTSGAELLMATIDAKDYLSTSTAVGGWRDDGSLTPSGVQNTVNDSGTTELKGPVIFGSGTAIRKHLSASASLNFAAWAGADCQIFTVTVSGAADGDSVALGIPNALASVAGVQFTAFVSGANTVTVRGCKITAGASADPAAATVRADVWQH